jgi:hypothetical protein
MAGTGELAALGLGVAPQLTFQMIAIGFLQATAILTAQAIGAGEHGRAGAVLRTALGHALVLGILFAAMSLLGPWFFRLNRPAGADRGEGRQRDAHLRARPARLPSVCRLQHVSGGDRPSENRHGDHDPRGLG